MCLSHSCLVITLLSTIEYIKPEILIFPTIGNINVIFNQLRTLHAIAYTYYIVEDNHTISEIHT